MDRPISKECRYPLFSFDKSSSLCDGETSIFFKWNDFRMVFKFIRNVQYQHKWHADIRYQNLFPIKVHKRGRILANDDQNAQD